MCTSGSSCGCATTTVDSAPSADEGDRGVRTTYTVSGMTCGGCANNVTRHLNAVAGVTGTEIDLTSGSVTVTSTAALETSTVRAAVEQAGYQLVG